jgi:hypothetical protein
MQEQFTSKEALQGMEQANVEKSHSLRWRIKICIVLSVFVLVVIIVIPIIIVFTRDRNDTAIWKDISPVSQLNVTHVLITGAWNDEIVIAGQDTKNNGMIEVYKYDETINQWSIQSNITMTGVMIQSMAVSLYGIRLVICVMNPIRFIVYENRDDIWTQYGETIYATDLVPNVTIIEDESITIPNIMLSNDGRILAISFQTGPKVDGTVHVLTDVNSLGGLIGGVWQRLGTPIQNVHEQDHGTFGTFTAMDGTGQKLVIASEHETTSVYKWSDTDKSWYLEAEYDESPLPPSGSLAISKDGTTIAIGSYQGTVDGSGELHILNEVWPWFIYNNDQPWLIDGVNGLDYNHQSANIYVALSDNGDHVLVGRQSHDTDDISLQVYQFDASKTDWTQHGLPFGQNHVQPYGNNISLDISSDSKIVAAAILGKVFVYKLVK